MELKHKELIAGLTLEQKCSLLSGMDFWQTEEISLRQVLQRYLQEPGKLKLVKAKLKQVHQKLKMEKARFQMVPTKLKMEHLL